MAKNKIAALVIAGLAFAMALHILSQSYTFIKMKVTDSKTINHAIESSLAEWKNAPEQSFTNPDVFHLEAKSANEKPNIILIVDPLCSDCAKVFQNLWLLQKKDKLSFSTYFYTLDNHCNPAITYRSDGLGCQVTSTIMCAEMNEQKGLALTSALYEQNKDITSNLALGPKILAQEIEKLGLDNNKLQSCLNADAAKKSLEAVKSIGQLKFTRLPVVIYKNKIYNAAVLDSAVEQLLEKNP